jgi:hypothetical protein
MVRIAPAVLSRLPRTIRPLPGETTDSYLGRLAHANRLDARALRFYIAGRRDRTPPFPVDRLAIATGVPAGTLRLAIPDLGFGYGTLDQNPRNSCGYPQRKADDGPPCRRCVLARGITMPVRCWKHPEDVICLRHRRWTGLASEEAQLDLSAQPAIIRAHKRHLRLVRRHGRDDTAFSFAVAEGICRRWHELRRHDTEYRELMQVFHGSSWQESADGPTAAAAAYPQAVALTRLLASPYWQAVSESRYPEERHPFFAEVRRTVAPGYVWPPRGRAADPLNSWINDRYMPGIGGYGLFAYHTWPMPGQVHRLASARS